MINIIKKFNFILITLLIIPFSYSIFVSFIEIDNYILNILTLMSEIIIAYKAYKESKDYFINHPNQKKLTIILLIIINFASIIGLLFSIYM